MPDRYSVWRSTLAFMTGLAIIGFATFSLMPPRLLGDTSKWGACHEQQVEDCHGHGIVDTLEIHGGWLSFQDEEVAEVSNQYAAMPSMHIGWSTWSACVMWPLVRRRWAKGLVLVYPFATFFCILVTGNHFWIDALGGLAAFGVGHLLARALTGWNEQRFLRREQRRRRRHPRRHRLSGSAGDGVPGEPGDRGAVEVGVGEHPPLSRRGPRMAGPARQPELGHRAGGRLHAQPGHRAPTAWPLPRRVRPRRPTPRERRGRGTGP